MADKVKYPGMPTSRFQEKEKGSLKHSMLNSVSPKCHWVLYAEQGKHKIEVDLAKGLPTGVPGELR